MGGGVEIVWCCNPSFASASHARFFPAKTSTYAISGASTRQPRPPSRPLNVEENLKDLFPESMSRTQVERAVRQAYRFGKKVGSQGDRALVRGQHDGLTIEMWVNRVTKTIETAYPVSF